MSPAGRLPENLGPHGWRELSRRHERRHRRDGNVLPRRCQADGGLGSSGTAPAQFQILAGAVTAAGALDRSHECDVHPCRASPVGTCAGGELHDAVRETPSISAAVGTCSTGTVSWRGARPLRLTGAFGRRSPGISRGRPIDASAAGIVSSAYVGEVMTLGTGGAFCSRAEPQPFDLVNDLDSAGAH